MGGGGEGVGREGKEDAWRGIGIGRGKARTRRGMQKVRHGLTPRREWRELQSAGFSPSPPSPPPNPSPVPYTHFPDHETLHELVCRLFL